MFSINDDMSIYVTRGDIVLVRVTADENETSYKFQPGDVVRIKVTEKKACENVVLQKDFAVEEETEVVDILLTEQDTKIGEVISKPVDYWYEVELNPFTDPQTIIGYDDDGPKIFKLFPEGRDIELTTIEPEDIPIVDSELNLTSERPVENQAIARAIVGLAGDVEAVEVRIEEALSEVAGYIENLSGIDEDIASIKSQAEAAGSNTADEYDDTVTYVAGSYCIHENVLYVSTVDITEPEGFNAEHWQQTTVAEIIGNYLPMGGGELEGALRVPASVANTTAQVRNIVIVDVDPGEGAEVDYPDGTIILSKA